MTKKESVRFSGMLQGEGVEATCTIRATKVTLAEMSRPFDSNYIVHSIENVSKSLPEGNYRLLANGEVINSVQYKNGQWLPSNA
jgi:hypothetical protein